MQRARVEFSGGWDEGGVDAVVVINDDGSERHLYWHPEYSYDYCDDGSYIRIEHLLSPSEMRDNQLYNLLASVIYDEYGSFADVPDVRGFADCVLHDDGKLEVLGWQS